MSDPVYIMLDAQGVARPGTFAQPQDMTQPVYAGLTLELVAADDPRIILPAPPPVQPSPRQWLERLAPATQAAITRAAVADATGALLLWLMKAAGNGAPIDVAAQETKDGVAALAAAGVITAADAATLLAP